MNHRKKAVLLIELAEKKALQDFEAWKTGYLDSNLKHQGKADAVDFIRKTYLAIQKWINENGIPKYLFTLNDKEALIRGWELCFMDWKDGFKPLPGTPEYSDECFDIHGKNLGVYIPARWLNDLSNRMKHRLCLLHLDECLNQYSTQKANQPGTRVLSLYYYYIMEAGYFHLSKKEIFAKGEEHGVSGQKLYEYHSNYKNGLLAGVKNASRICKYLDEVIPMLSEYPNAQKLAQAELLRQKKNT